MYIQFPLYKGITEPGLYNSTMLTKATTVLYLPCMHLKNMVLWFLQIPVGHCK